MPLNFLAFYQPHFFSTYNIHHSSHNILLLFQHNNSNHIFRPIDPFSTTIEGFIMSFQNILILDFITSDSIKLHSHLDTHLYFVNFFNQQLQPFQTGLLRINSLAYCTAYFILQQFCFFNFCRDDWIRTSGPHYPKVVR